VTSLAQRFDDVLAGTPLDAKSSPASARFAERRGDDHAAARLSEPVLRGLARLVATQPEVASYLANRPAWLERASELGPNSLAQRGARLEEHGEALARLDLEAALDVLRLRRRDETALAACADLGGLATFEEVSEYLSLVAETTARFALALAHRDLPGGSGADAFAVIGMGKIAGREFTYHSDLDLIFLYEGGAEQIARASRLAQRLISYLTTMTGAGIAYAVDTRLRPSGQQGMLVASFEGYQRYQTREAATWEHLAMLRARPIAGALDPAAERLRAVRAHVLPAAKPLWPELAELRQRVIDERARGDDGASAFKTGAGGLMDVDFLAGGGLIERGAKHFPELPSVRAMWAAALGAQAQPAVLGDYQTLRRVEACARWVAGRAVEQLPAELAITAELVEPGSSAEALRERVAGARRRIRAAYDRVVTQGTIAALDPVK
jgi:glutamate-ammonia-ligase adenylyltransferase